MKKIYSILLSLLFAGTIGAVTFEERIPQNEEAFLLEKEGLLAELIEQEPFAAQLSLEMLYRCYGDDFIIMSLKDMNSLVEFMDNIFDCFVDKESLNDVQNYLKLMPYLIDEYNSSYEKENMTALEYVALGSVGRFHLIYNNLQVLLSAYNAEEIIPVTYKILNSYISRLKEYMLPLISLTGECDLSDEEELEEIKEFYDL